MQKTIKQDDLFKVYNNYHKVLNVWKNKKLIGEYKINEEDDIYNIFEDVFKNLQNIKDYINKYDNINTKAQHEKTLSKILNVLKEKNKDNNDYKEKHKEQAIFITKTNKEILKQKIKDNQDTEKNEKFIKWETIKDYYKKAELEKNKDIIHHYIYLLYAFLVHYPPQRTSIYKTLKFENINNIIKNNKFVGNETDENLIFYNNNMYFILINKDKVSNKSGSIINKIDDKDLNEIIKESYEKYPRTYLFENLQTKSNYSDDQLSRFLKSFNDKMTFNICRSSFISWAFALPKFSGYIKRVEIAQKMRNSVIICMSWYQKYNNEEYEKEEKKEHDKSNNDILNNLIGLPLYKNENISDDE